MYPFQARRVDVQCSCFAVWEYDVSASEMMYEWGVEVLLGSRSRRDDVTESEAVDDRREMSRPCCV